MDPEYFESTEEAPAHTDADYERHMALLCDDDSSEDEA